MKNIVFILLVSFFLTTNAQNKEAFKIYKDSTLSSYESILTACKDADFVFFGEDHDNPIAHWLEYELLADLYNEKKKELIVGAEMFEADNQLILNEYLEDKIDDKKFQEEVRLWPNYKTDYKPLIKFCKDSNVQFVATNIPRRYASMVSKKGFGILDSLSSEAKSYIARLPIEYNDSVGCYKDILDGMDKEHATPNIAKAQAIKDATMSYFILKNYKKGNLFLHYNGSFHSNKHDGIIRYLTAEKKKAKVVVITTISQKNISKIEKENLNSGDFIICITENMTRSY